MFGDEVPYSTVELARTPHDDVLNCNNDDVMIDRADRYTVYRPSPRVKHLGTKLQLQQIR